MKLSICRFFAAFALGISVAGAASALNVDSVISQLISAGKVGEARQVLAATGPGINDREFFEGRVLKSRRQYARAIAVFRDILRREPGYINARRELAHTLLLSGNFETAEVHFRQLLEVDPSPQMRLVYRRYLRVIATNKPRGFAGSVGLVPSTNVNRGSSLPEFDDGLGNAKISEDSKAKSGVGFQLGLSGYFRKTLDRRSRLTLHWSLRGVKYRDSAFDKAMTQVSVSFDRTTAWGSWSVAPYLRTDWARQDEDPGAETIASFGPETRAVGVRLAAQRRISARDSLSLAFTAEARRFPVAENRTGPAYSLSGAFDRRVRPDLTVGFGLGLDRSRPRSAYLKYDGVKLSASLGKVWESGLQTRFGVSIGRSMFEGDYIFRDDPRSDEYWGLSISLFDPKLVVNGLAPRLSCSYTRHRSNIAFFVYNVRECQLSLTRDF